MRSSHSGFAACPILLLFKAFKGRTPSWCAQHLGRAPRSWRSCWSSCCCPRTAEELGLAGSSCLAFIWCSPFPPSLAGAGFLQEQVLVYLVTDVITPFSSFHVVNAPSCIYCRLSVIEETVLHPTLQYLEYPNLLSPACLHCVSA